MKRFRIFIMMLLVAALGISCASKRNGATETKDGEATKFVDMDNNGARMDEEQEKKLLKERKAHAKDAIKTACESDDDCDAIAFGSKPCGGPWTYLAYSLAHTDEARLQVLVSEVNGMEQTMNQKYGYVSDCMFVSKPQVKCEQSNCVAIGLKGG